MDQTTNESDGLSHAPWWAQFIVRVGISTAFAAALLWFLLTSVSGAMAPLAAAQVQSAIGQVEIVKEPRADHRDARRAPIRGQSWPADTQTLDGVVSETMHPLRIGTIWNGRCPVCQLEDRRSTVTIGASFSALVGFEAFYDAEGVYHEHDPNEVVVTYRCSRGHPFFRVVVSPCPAGDYPRP